MEWTEQDRANLRSWRKNIDDEDIRVKEEIKRLLLGNKNIIHVLHNEELEESGAEADEYYGVNILPYYLISPTQHNVQNFLCFEVKFREMDRFNSIIKLQQIVFYILCEQKSIIEEDTGLARHDLLSALVKDQFNWSNFFGTQIHCISDDPSVVDTNYSCRTLVFQCETPANIIRTTDKTRVINHEIRK